MRPKSVPELLWALITACWQQDPVLRPHMSEVGLGGGTLHFMDIEPKTMPVLQFTKITPVGWRSLHKHLPLVSNHPTVGHAEFDSKSMFCSIVF